MKRSLLTLVVVLLSSAVLPVILGETDGDQERSKGTQGSERFEFHSYSAEARPYDG